MDVAGVSTSSSTAYANVGVYPDTASRRLVAEPAGTANATGASAGVQVGEVSASSSQSGTDKNEKAPTDTVTLGSNVKLTPEELAMLSKLQARDQQVRQHEMAHLAASGGLATSGASFTYEKGPDGISYAIGGEVSIDTSPGRTPQDTIRRAQIIEAAALAPADPSGQDRTVAAAAQQMALHAYAEMAQASARTTAVKESQQKQATGSASGEVKLAGQGSEQTDTSGAGSGARSINVYA